MNPRFIHGLSEIIEPFDALFVDLWGCVVDGVAAYPEAVECLLELRRSGRPVVLLTNIPRPSAKIRDILADMGVVETCYDALVTSGDATVHALKTRDDPWHAALGTRFFHIGTNSNDALLSEIEGKETDIESADYILTTGFRNRDGATPAIYDETFTVALGRNLPMVCANPDRAAPHGDQIRYRAGSVAEAYEKRGGEVRYHGKPDHGIYRLGFDHLGDIAPDRVLMIGDNLATDIEGARNVGIASLWIAGGLHAEEVGLTADAPLDPDEIRAALASAGGAPFAVAKSLRW
ncbi:MAG: TIGR01459 family HAD-type hydrolase [Pseudomonadota bacterium]